MGRFVWAIVAVILLQYPSAAQSPGSHVAMASVNSAMDDFNPANVSAVANDPSDTARTEGVIKAVSPDYAPMTTSERTRKYILGAFGPGAIVRAAAGAGIAHWEMTPKEWRAGPEAYGDRFGNAMAVHVIREALEFGGSLALKEDNRYFRSTDTGFLKRSKHAVISAFTARNEAGGQHLAYSRFAAAAGSSFLSRLWQPPSTNTAGDAAVSFGITMVTDIGWNFFHEFCPKGLTKKFKVH